MTTNPPAHVGEIDEEAEENEEQMLKRKPWGDTRHFCPVALAERGVLWPGLQDVATRSDSTCSNTLLPVVSFK